MSFNIPTVISFITWTSVGNAGFDIGYTDNDLVRKKRSLYTVGYDKELAAIPGGDFCIRC